MTKIILTKDCSGNNPFFMGYYPDIISFYRKPSLKVGDIGNRYGNLFPVHAESSCVLEKIKNDKEIYFLQKFYLLYNERGLVKDISLESFDNFDSGLGGYFVFSKKQLKNIFDFQRVSRKRMSKKRKKEIVNFLTNLVYGYSCFFNENIYNILLEKDGEVVNSIDFVFNKNKEELINESKKYFDLVEFKFEDQTI